MTLEFVGGPRDGESVTVSDPLPVLAVPLMSASAVIVQPGDPIDPGPVMRCGYYRLAHWRNRPFVRPLHEWVYHWQGEA